MPEEIINKVAASALEVFDLEDYFPEGKRVALDISQFLIEGFLLKEKEFREQLKNYNWQQFANQYVALHCTTDAILPAWAFQLVSVYVANFAKAVVLGNLNQLEIQLFQNVLHTIDYSKYANKPLILKGCSKKPVPAEAYIMALSKLQPIAKSIMYGEACSAVPLYKSKK